MEMNLLSSTNMWTTKLDLDSFWGFSNQTLRTGYGTNILEQLELNPLKNPPGNTTSTNNREVSKTRRYKYKIIQTTSTCHGESWHMFTLHGGWQGVSTKISAIGCLDLTVYHHFSIHQIPPQIGKDTCFMSLPAKKKHTQTPSEWSFMIFQVNFNEDVYIKTLPTKGT